MTPTLEFLVEELSAKQVLDRIVPRVCPGVAFEVRAFQGKPDLLRKLPQRLAGYSAWAPQSDVRVVVLVDRDTDDCMQLKEQLEAIVAGARLRTPRTALEGERIDMITRIAVEELEAWFFGDISALRAAYPRIPVTLADRASFRTPDAIAGGTAEALELVLKRAGYYSTGLPKVTNAELVAQHMDVDVNNSSSFIAFRDGVRRLINQERVS